VLSEKNSLEFIERLSYYFRNFLVLMALFTVVCRHWGAEQCNRDAAFQCASRQVVTR